jgi:2-succinyl-5-enolpyruvyl-6-hydroxy-3-cyclohexene-1-carboxylate synthase
VPQAVKHLELIYNQQHRELQPDLIITWGKSVISKNLKKYLRRYPPKHHWHLQQAGAVADPFQSQPQILPVTAEDWFKERRLNTHHNPVWYQLWQEQEQAASLHLEQSIDFDHWNELSAAAVVMKTLKGVDLHLANSMPVRWADLFGINGSVSKVWANRGTSGIDGCNSTLVGHSWFSQRPQVLLTGDMAFRYDRNAFWHQYPLKNLSIIILNNGGGGIFRLIDGPADQPELEEYFVTQQSYQAQFIAQEIGAGYLAAGSFEELSQGLNQLKSSKQPLILEVMVKCDIRSQYKNLKNFNNQ